MHAGCNDFGFNDAAPVNPDAHHSRENTDTPNRPSPPAFPTSLAFLKRETSNAISPVGRVQL